jgi:diaminohydroxyphosphoribosylaminopyrimidine deaminase/5-amino-6-(5-phosphoribosylamino)uracil reductase
LGDPFPQVNGSGFARLREAGVEVINGILEKEAIWQNRIFLHNVRQQRPFIILKWAETLNGMIAPQPAARKQISGHAAHLLLHRWRAEEAAICIGRHTLETDQPQLTNRYWGNRQPLRIILDPHLKVNSASLKRMGSESDIWLVNIVHKGSDGNIRWIQCSEANFLHDLMRELHLAGIASVLVEGGPFTLQTFIRAGLADEHRIIRSRHISWNEGIPAPNITGTLRDHLICQEDEILILQP